MKLLAKIVFGLIIGVVLLFGAAGAYFKFFFDPNDIRANIAQAVEQETGRRFAIEGDLSISWFPWLGFDVGRTRLGEDPAFGDGDFLSFDSASARVKLMPLFSKRVEIDKLTLNGLEVTLVRNAAGADNWASLLSDDTGAPAEPAQTPQASSSFSTEQIGGVELIDATIVLDDRQAGTRMSATALNARTGAIRPGKPVSLAADFTLTSDEPQLLADVTFAGEARLDGDDIRIEQPVMTMRGAQQKLSETMVLDRFELELEAPGMIVAEDKITVPSPQMTLSTAGEGVGGELTMSMVAAQMIMLPAEETVTLGGPQVTFALAGSGAVKKADGTARGTEAVYSIADGAANITAPELRAKLAGDDLPKNFELALNAPSLSMAAGGDALTVNDYTLSAVGINATGTLNVTNLNTAPVITGPIKVAPFSLRELFARMDIPLETADPEAMTQFSVQGDLRATENSMGIERMNARLDASTVTGKAAISDLEQSAYTFDLVIDSIDADRYLSPDAAPADGDAGSAADAITLPTDTLRTLNLNGTLRVGQMKIADLQSRNVRVGLTAADGRLRVFPSEAELYGGKYTGDIRIDASGQEPTISMNETVTGIDFAAFAATVMPDNPLKGRLTGNVLLSARGENTAQMQKTLNGSTNFDFADGLIEGVDLWHNVRTVIALANRESAPAAVEPKVTRFQVLKGRADITDGVILTDALDASVPHLDVNGSGRVDLNDRSVDFKVQAKVVEEEGLELLPRERKLVGFRVPVFIGGTIDAPVVRKEESVTAVIAQLAKRKLADKLGLINKTEGEEASQDEAEDAVDEKKEELKDKVDKKVKDLFKDLIG